MGKRNIVVPLSQSGIDNAIKQLTEYQRQLDSKRNDLITRLGQLGLTVMNVTLTGWAYPGTNDVTVTAEFNGDTCTIMAKGRAVAFIEFGTGILHPTGAYHGVAGADPHGTYGHHQGSNPKGWIYKGEQGDPSLSIPVPGKDGVWRTWGNDPANAFPKTIEEIKKNVQRVAREVFE